jgi:hypothetical protein
MKLRRVTILSAVAGSLALSALPVGHAEARDVCRRTAAGSVCARLAVDGPSAVVWVYQGTTPRTPADGVLVGAGCEVGSDYVASAAIQVGGTWLPVPASAVIPVDVC